MSRRVNPDNCCPLCGQLWDRHNKSTCERRQRKRHTTEGDLRDKRAEHGNTYGQKLSDGFSMLEGEPERDRQSYHDDEEE